jgi:hypothetical protein
MVTLLLYIAVIAALAMIGTTVAIGGLTLVFWLVDKVIGKKEYKEK